MPAARETAVKYGFDIVHTYILPDNDWWTEYYLPLKKRHDELKDESDPDIRQAIEIGKAEIALRETHPKDYGYVGFVLKREPEPPILLSF